MNKDELLKLLREANITSADLAEIEQETKQSKSNNHKYECNDCKVKFASNTKKRKCPSCKSNNLSLLETKTERKKETQTEEKSYIHKTGLNIKNLGQSQESSNNNDEEKKFTRSEQINLKKLKNIKKIDTGVKLKNDQDFDSKVVFNKTPRDRQQFKLIKIRCNGQCGEIKEVNPAYIRGRSKTTWECDKCLLSKKSQR